MARSSSKPRVTLGEAGASQGYSVAPGGETLRGALMSVLVDDMKGERLPDELNGYQQDRSGPFGSCEARGILRMSALQG